MAIIKIGNPAIDLDAAEIPNLSANKITSDTLADARIPANALNSNIDLTNLSASNLTSGTIPTARITALPAGVGGKVLQVVQGTDTAETDTSSTSYVATGLSVNITPSSSSNKVLIIAMGMIDNDSSGTAPKVTLYRDSTNIGIADGLSRNYATVRLIVPVTLSKLDTPNSTSQITYAVYIKSASGSQVRFGESTQQTIVAMEIAG